MIGAMRAKASRAAARARSQVRRLRRPAARFSDVYPRLEKELTSVLYHVVTDERLPYVDHLYRHRDVETFKADLEFFARRFRFVSYENVVRHLREGEELPPYSMFLSFDDGHKEGYDVVAPILKEMGIPATFFVTVSAVDNDAMIPGHLKSLCIDRILGLSESEAGLLVSRVTPLLEDGTVRDRPSLLRHIRGLRDYYRYAHQLDEIAALAGIDVEAELANTRPYMTTDQVHRLVKDGFSIGAHGIRHLKFSYLPLAERETELLGSVRKIQTAYHLTNVGFAFPNSGADVSEEWVRDTAARCSGVTRVFDTRGFSSPDKVIIHRVTFDERWQNGDRFATARPEKILALAMEKSRV